MHALVVSSPVLPAGELGQVGAARGLSNLAVYRSAVSHFGPTLGRGALPAARGRAVELAARLGPIRAASVLQLGCAFPAGRCWFCWWPCDRERVRGGSGWALAIGPGPSRSAAGPVARRKRGATPNANAGRAHLLLRSQRDERNPEAANPNSQRARSNPSHRRYLVVIPPLGDCLEQGLVIGGESLRGGTQAMAGIEPLLDAAERFQRVLPYNRRSMSSITTNLLSSRLLSDRQMQPPQPGMMTLLAALTADGSGGGVCHQIFVAVQQAVEPFFQAPRAIIDLGFSR